MSQHSRSRKRSNKPIGEYVVVLLGGKYNKRTQQFEASTLDSSFGNPSQKLLNSSTNQMNAYFDVESFQNSANYLYHHPYGRPNGDQGQPTAQKKKITKKEIQMYKAKKMEKKKQKLLKEYSRD